MEKITAMPSHTPLTAPLHVLYEDNHLIAVEKPAGMLVQAEDVRDGKVGQEILLDLVKAYIKEKYQKPGNVFLGLLHRLDRPVRGIVLFAKTSKAASRLSAQFRERTTDKIYHAWVEGIVEKDRGTLIHFIIKDENRRKSFVYETEARGSQRAELRYTVVERVASPKHPMTLVKIELKTGRFHQIRAQFGYIHHPIIGDVKYGASMGFPDTHIELSGTSLSFETATGGETKTISLSVPPRPVIC